jgi:hypothetical protein
MSLWAVGSTCTRKSVRVLCLVMSLETLALGQSRVLYVPGSSQRICQLLGETDIQFKTPTLNQTETNFGLRGADLGSSFEYQGAAWFLFGDSSAVGGQQPDGYDSDAHSTADCDAHAHGGTHRDEHGERIDRNYGALGNADIDAACKTRLRWRLQPRRHGHGG